MQQVPSEPDIAVLLGDFDRLNPVELFDHLTKPELLVKWWPPHAATDPQAGGNFIFNWPDNNWTLRGEYLYFVPGKHLRFTWCWDHEPVEHGNQVVDMWIEPYLDRGSLLGIYHGKFDGTPEDQAARQGIVEGWIHFMMHLSGLEANLPEA